MPLGVATINLITAGAGATAYGSLPVQAGSLLVCVLRTAAAGSSGGHNVLGSLNGAFTRIAVADNGTAQHISMWYKENAVAGPDQFTASGTGPAQQTRAIFYEITGADTTAPFISGEALGNITSATQNPLTSYVKNSVPDSIFIAGLAPNGGSVYAVNGANTVPLGSWIDSAVTSAAKADYYIATASASARHGWSSNALTNYAHVIAAFAQATTSTPAGIERAGLSHITLVDYATPDLIPAGLRPVGIVSSASMPDRIRRVKPNWVATPDLAPPEQVVYGAVQYASDDLAPPNLKVLGVEA